MVVACRRRNCGIWDHKRFGFVIAWETSVGMLFLFVFVISEKVDGAFLLGLVEIAAASEEENDENEGD